MGVIINGVYHSDKEVPKDTIPPSLRELNKQHFITQESKRFAHHLIQPNNKDGSPNKDFIDYYPEDAKAHGFIKENNQENRDETAN